MLHDWATGWYVRHDRQLATEGVRFPVRVAHRTYMVTTEQALSAVSRTVQELDAALADHRDWGCDAQGRPCELAMRGLINRRVASRLVDQLRRPVPAGEQSLSAPVGEDPAQPTTLGDILPSDSGVTRAETLLWLKQVLAAEPRVTREVIMRRLANEQSDEIATELGLSHAAARQRISRFRRQYRGELVDAA
jgi:hypothetical protein